MAGEDGADDVELDTRGGVATVASGILRVDCDSASSDTGDVLLNCSVIDATAGPPSSNAGMMAAELSAFGAGTGRRSVDDGGSPANAAGTAADGVSSTAVAAEDEEVASNGTDDVFVSASGAGERTGTNAPADAKNAERGDAVDNAATDAETEEGTKGNRALP